MARSKSKSFLLEAARQGLAGLKSITPARDLGASLTVAAYETEITHSATV